MHERKIRNHFLEEPFRIDRSCGQVVTALKCNAAATVIRNFPAGKKGVECDAIIPGEQLIKQGTGLVVFG
jgi:hypothetical protein